MTQKSLTKNTFRGFTLIELLVVISIIAVLMGIMMPALKAAKEQAYKVTCAARLRSVSQGPLLFAADNDGWLPMLNGNTLADGNLPPNSCPECLAWGSVLPQRSFWYIDVAPYLGVQSHPYLKADYLSVEKEGIEAPKIYQCPSMKKTVYNAKGLAYGWNWTGLGYICKQSFVSFDKYWKPYRVSQIESAQITAMIGENPLGQDLENEKMLPRHCWGNEVSDIYTGGRRGFYFYGDRHSGGSIYIAVDGHVDYRTYGEYVEDFLEYYPTKRGGCINFPSPRRCWPGMAH